MIQLDHQGMRPIFLEDMTFKQISKLMIVHLVTPYMF